EQRGENGVVQRLHRPLVVVAPVGIAEAAGEQQVGQLGDQIFQIEVVELVAGVLRVPVLHLPPASQILSFSDPQILRSSDSQILRFSNLQILKFSISCNTSSSRS